MARFIFDLLRRRFILFQILALLFWLGLELAGYGFGALDGLMQRRLTNADQSTIGTWIAGAPPGPVRLSRAERSDVEARIKQIFGVDPPKHVRLSELEWMYELKPGSFCRWRGSNVETDPKECNRLARTVPIFQALLEAMHPKTETLMLEEVTGFKSDKITVAFFVGRSGKGKILFDLSRVSTSNWDYGKGFKLKAYHAGGLTDLPLGKAQSVGSGLFLIDDPGPLGPRPGACGKSLCPSLLLLYGHDFQGYRNSEGQLSTHNLATIEIGAHLQRRYDLYAALMGKANAPVAAVLPQEAYKQTRFAVTQFQTKHLERAIEALFGAGAKDRVVYAPSGYDVAFARVSAIRHEGKLFLLWDGGTPYSSLGTDRFVFDVIETGKRRRLDGVTASGGVHLIPFAALGTDTKRRLEVRKFIEQGGKVWSEVSEIDALVAPLLGS
jgi:hypothetical protein